MRVPYLHFIFILVTVVCRAAMGASVVVNSTADPFVPDGDTTSIAALTTTPGADGLTLREAIIAANNTAGPDTITFSGNLDILLNNDDTNITQALTIDGGANTVNIGSALSSFPLGIGVSGTSAVTIRNIGFNGCGTAIQITNSSSCTIAGCRFGLLSFNLSDIALLSASSNCIIGGATTADRNYISGGSIAGLSIKQGRSTRPAR